MWSFAVPMERVWLIARIRRTGLQVAQLMKRSSLSRRELFKIGGTAIGGGAVAALAGCVGEVPRASAGEGGCGLPRESASSS